MLIRVIEFCIQLFQIYSELTFIIRCPPNTERHNIIINDLSTEG